MDHERVLEGPQTTGARRSGPRPPARPSNATSSAAATARISNPKTLRGPSTGRKRRILATTEEKQALWEEKLEENDEATLERHCELWEERRGVRVSFGHDEPSDPREAGLDAQKKMP